jgi:hypothetical protein
MMLSDRVKANYHDFRRKNIPAVQALADAKDFTQFMEQIEATRADVERRLAAGQWYSTNLRRWVDPSTEYKPFSKAELAAHTCERR